MRSKTKSKLLKLFVFSSASAIALYSLLGFTASEGQSTTPTAEQVAKKATSQIEERAHIAKLFANQVRANDLPAKMKLNWDGKEQDVAVKYTIDTDLQKEADRLLKSYKPDYGAIFVMDATTGEVLTMSSFQRDDAHAPNINLQATFPAASIFKVVTATAAVDKAGVNPSHKIHYNGGAHTLYKKNVLSERVTRWTNVITLKDAFARSINTAFGRLSIENLHPEDLNEYSNRFMFNQEIPADFPVEMGVAYIPPGKGFEMAEAASGYTKSNRMSPVQGAMIAASVANDGQVVVPYVVSNVQDDSGKTLYQGSTLSHGTTMSKESAAKLRELMGQTVLAGTSRRSFRPIMKDRKFREIEMGGKTGHLTGDNPRGRVDWFVGYALDEDRKIAVAAITVNKKFWTVKSAHLGQSMFRKYFSPIVAQQKAASRKVSSR
ncbi:penicillin-binding transpeptidase domain-containing protein [Bdellovibrio svalbardensis]|uniref:Penicillin-binding transpeptidase domain-containing protein n=1 Tax=Bdellovibrio svalbardensis TaxID=2972972 RepID=A0ABT6DEK7_9BACT|nr:penicillin-binding transpeptidase domain-containing protein [Bdellovibrio svalbardensis]MDG0815258.1 penicillin-binding transpeptidase domain-containing protein [Bdellovibrio svalbardensis]